MSIDLSITKGNSKLGKGIYTFSTLPGYKFITKKDGTQLTTIHGTCKDCCDGCEDGGCYAIRDARLHNNATIPAWTKNTLALREHPDETFETIKQYLIDKKAKSLRWNVSGEIETYDILERIVKLAKALPTVNIYFYTKRFALIDRYLKTSGSFPDNLSCNISKWHDNVEKAGFDFKDESGVNIFAYDDGSEPELKSWVHCPAVDTKGHKTGVTCDKCGRCMKKGVRTAVYAH